jgi:hypothetical protein
MFKWMMRLLSAAVVVVVVFGLWARKQYETPGDNASSSTTPSPARPGSPGTSTPARGQTGNGCGDAVLGDERVGMVRIGASVASVTSQCRVLRDTVQPGGEGTTERRITVFFLPDSVEATIVDDRVWRIDVTSPRIRTSDSLGVGSSLGDLLRFGDAQGAAGEGRFFVLSPSHCGLSFELAGGIPPRRSRGWDQKELSTLSPAIKVKRVLVVHAPENCRPSSSQ